MSRAGQAGEIGSVFRCAVATHLAVHGLRSHAVAGLDLPAGVDPIRLEFETSDPTDDIRVTFSDGRRGYISAKRRVTRGRPLNDTVAGWIEQVRSLGSNDLLILAAEEFAGPTRDLDRVLRRHRAGLPMETRDERDALAALTDLLPDDAHDKVLNQARILHLPSSTRMGRLRAFLSALMDYALADPQGERAVTALSDLFHRQAGEALGSGIDDWVVELNNAGLSVSADRAGPAGMRAAARIAAVAIYRERLAAGAGRIDLSLLAEDLPPIVVDDLVGGLKVDIEGSRSPDDLLRTLRRWRRMLLVGQPGSGKSVALREVAAHCAGHRHAPIPIRVSLPQMVRSHAEQLTIDAVIDAATAGVVAEEQRPPLADYLGEEVARGRAILLCDGLDECGARATWAAQQLADILVSAHPNLGFVLATRASAQLPATRLGLPRVELAPPRDLTDTVEEILAGCARERIPEAERGDWLAKRRTWIKEAKEQHGHLLEVPLLAILLALVCANASEWDLPKGRAILLHRAVEQSVQRWEQNRGTLDTTRPWSPTLTTAMLLQGFIVLGRLLDGGATPRRADALLALEAMIRDPARWRMPPAQAHELAEQVLRFWDEHVAVFVVNAAGELTTRSKVFAEIAAAMWATECELDTLQQWLVEALAYTESDGAIALAAGLDSRMVDALLEVGAEGSAEATLMVADLCDREIVDLSTGQVRRTLDQLVLGARKAEAGDVPIKRAPKKAPARLPGLWDETRDKGPWPFVEAACRLPLPISDRARRTEFIADCELASSVATIAAALCELTDAAGDDSRLTETGRTAVHAALALPLPPESEMVAESRRRFVMAGGAPLTPGLAIVALEAANRLDELEEWCAETIFQIGMHATLGYGERIFSALSRAGVDTSRRWASLFSKMTNWLSSHVENEADLLADVSSLAESDPEVAEMDLGFWSLTDLGDLLAVTRYQDVSTREFARAFVHDDADTRRRWLDAVADAYGLNKTMAASQALHVLHIRGQTPESERRVSDDWFVASVKPVEKPGLRTPVTDVLTVEQQLALLDCLEADSDWIAYSAAEVLVNLSTPPWNSNELFERDMSNWPRDRAALMYLVAILTAGSERDGLLRLAANAELGDYRYAAKKTVALAPDSDPDGSIEESLRRDPDMSVRPKDARKQSPVPDYWTCNDCKAVNGLDVEDCPSCDDGVRPPA